MSKRRQFTPEQKVAIIRRHWVENVPGSDLCDELGKHANQYYNWQKQLFENAGSVCERRPNKANQLIQEHVQLEKELGEPYLNGIWVPHDVRDTVVDYLRRSKALFRLPVRLTVNRQRLWRPISC